MKRVPVFRHDVMISFPAVMWHCQLDEMYQVLLQAIASIKHAVVPTGTSEEAALRTFVRNVMNAVREGKLRLTCCFVMHLPFHTEGDLMPVQVPCGCTMSWAASQIAVREQLCQLCNSTDIPCDAECPVDTTVLRLVQAGSHCECIEGVSQLRRMKSAYSQTFLGCL